MRGALRGKWWPLTAICLANLMLLIDVTIVITAMPEIARELDAGLPAQQWVLDAYALALAALLLPVGVLGDHRGHRSLYLLGLAVFAVSSLACGLAPGAGVLIASRVAQGVGAAAMFATSAALLAAAYTGRDRGVAFGVWSAVGGAASVTGVLAGGLLTEYAASLDYPRAKAAPSVNQSDVFARAVRANAKAQATSLAKLATLSQKHTAQPRNTVTPPPAPAAARARARRRRRRRGSPR